MFSMLDRYSGTLKLVGLLSLLAVGLYIEWDQLIAYTGLDQTQRTREVSTRDQTVPDWSNHSIVPTDVQSFDNGTYSIEFNDRIRVKFVRRSENGAIEWPRTEPRDVKAVSTESETFKTALSNSLETNTTSTTDTALEVTNLELQSAEDPEVRRRVSVTFNDRLTVHDVRLMDGEDGPWLAWPSMQFEGEWVDLVEPIDGNLNNEIILSIQKAMEDTNQVVQSTPADSDLPVFPKPEGSVPARVIHVYDGDTIKARLLDGSGEEVVVRIQGIDCPESSRNEKCKTSEYVEGMSCSEEIKYGKRAGRVAKRRLSDERITLVPTEDGEFKTGYYDRRIAYVRMSNGVDFGLEMVNDGYCKDTSESFSHQRGETYRRYENPLAPLN